MLNDLVSVILPCYNESLSVLDLALTSIQNQTYTNLEIIIILDNPNNEILKQYLREKKEGDSRIVLLENNINLGLVKSLNLGISKSKGFYIVRMDADDISSLDRIDTQLEYIKNNKTDLVYTGMNHANHSGKLISKDVLKKISNKKMYFLLKFSNISNHPTWTFTRELYNSIGGYRLIPYCEDYDFILRSISCGYRIDRLDVNCLTYRHRDDSISRTNNGRQVFNSYIVSKEYRRGRLTSDVILSTISSEKNEVKYIRFCRYFDVYQKFNYTSKTFKKIIYFSILIFNPVTRNILISKILRRLLTSDKYEQVNR